MGATLQHGGKTRSRRGRRRSAPMSEINVTPFVDVMLVLLIIFMVAAPLLTAGVPLDLPKTTAEALPTEQEEPLTVNIDNTGRIYLQETPVAFETLLPKLTAVREARGEGGGKVFLRADGGLDYARVAEVMAVLRNSGFSSIGLVTDQVSGTATE
ncbi:MAG: protein TolR [Pseudomonadota bacterium]